MRQEPFEEGAEGGGIGGDSRLVISIAMCTYNGGTYLGEQLASFLKQTRLPDELVVCDDGSTDDTLQVLDSFSKEAPFPVKVYRNQERLGPTRNFERAISLCSGDYIFLSDQDDVWMPQKVNTLLQALESDPGAGYAFCDALIVDEALHVMGYTMWQSIRFTSRQRRKFERAGQMDVLLKHNVVTGATMAFRAGLKDIVLPIPDTAIHDEWIALLASSLGMCGVPIDEPLVQYRQHPQQLLGGRKVGFAERIKEASLTDEQSFVARLRQEEAKYSQALDRLALTGRLNEYAEQSLGAKIRHFRARESIHERARHARLPRVLGEYFTLRYHRFSFGWKSAARDLLL
jgi:glycosyltransferase involved in cell wall biosynthesis